jgi:hypothetical protein
MAKKTVNIGTSANKGNGDPLRTAFGKINDNFDEIYGAIGVDGTIFNPLSVDSNILPDADNTRDLGSAEKQWRHVYTAGGSIYLDNIKLTNNAGKLEITKVINPGEANEAPDPIDSDAGSELGGGGAFNQSLNTGDSVTFNSVGATTVNVSQINGTNPGDELVIQANNHNWTFDTNGSLTIPGDIKSEGAINIDINLSDSTLRRWRFSEGGDLTLPAGGDIKNSNGNSVLGSLVNGTETFTLSATGNATFSGETGGVNRGIVWDYGAVAGGVNSRIRQDEDGLTVRAYTENSGSYAAPVRILTNQGDNERVWQFDGAGDLTLPTGGDILDSTGTSVLGGAAGDGLTSNDDINITVNSEDSSSYTWNFGQTGTLTFPDGSVQTTAYTGSGAIGTFFVVVNDDGTVSKSTDGVSWTTGADQGAGINRVATDGVTVAMIQSSQLSWTTFAGLEASTYVSGSSAIDDSIGEATIDWNQIDYAGGYFVAVGNITPIVDGFTQGVYGYSTDGRVWTFMTVDQTVVEYFGNDPVDSDWEFSDVDYNGVGWMFSVSDTEGGGANGGGVYITDLTATVTSARCFSMNITYKAAWNGSAWYMEGDNSLAGVNTNLDPRNGTFDGPIDPWATDIQDLGIGAGDTVELAGGNGYIAASDSDGHVAWSDDNGQTWQIVTPIPYTRTISAITQASPAVVTSSGESGASGEKIIISGSSVSGYNGTFYWKSADSSLYTDQALTTPFDTTGLAPFTGTATLTWSNGQYIDAMDYINGYFYIGNDDEQIARTTNFVSWTIVDNQTSSEFEYWNDIAGFVGTGGDIGDIVVTVEEGTTTLTLANKDFTLETTRTGDQDADINIYAADDIFIEANGDDIALSAADQVRINTGSFNGDPGEYSTWTFDNNGALTFPDGTIQTTAYTGQTTGFTLLADGSLQAVAGVIDPTVLTDSLQNGRPDFLIITPRSPDRETLDTHYGFDSTGMWFTGDTEETYENQPAYPIHTRDSFPADTKVVVEFDVNKGDFQEDHSVCVYPANGVPHWSWSSHPSRIAGFVDGSVEDDEYQAELEGLTDSSSGQLVTDQDVSRARFTYDPLAELTTFELLDVDGIVTSRCQTPGRLARGQDYMIGFDADWDNAGVGERSYFSNLTITTSVSAKTTELTASGEIKLPNTVRGFVNMQGPWSNNESDTEFQTVTTHDGFAYIGGETDWTENNTRIDKYSLTTGELVWSRVIGAGRGAQFDISWTGGVYTINAFANTGQGYRVGDVLYVSGSDFTGGSEFANRAIITVTAVGSVFTGPNGSINTATIAGTAPGVDGSVSGVGEQFGDAQGFPTSIKYDTITDTVVVLILQTTYGNATDNFVDQVGVIRINPVSGDVVSHVTLTDEGDIYGYDVAIHPTTGATAVVGAKFNEYKQFGALVMAVEGNGYFDILKSNLDAEHYPGNQIPSDPDYSFLISGTGITGTESVDSVNFYESISGTTQQGSGTVDFDVATTGTGPYAYGTVTIDSGGLNYRVGHKIKYLGTQIPGGTTPENDLILTVDAVDGSGTITAASASGTAPSDGTIMGLTAGTNYNVGSGLTLNITVNSVTGSRTADLNQGGSNYVVNDVVVIAGTQFAGGTTPTNDVTVTIMEIGLAGGNVTGTVVTAGTTPTNIVRIRVDGVDFTVVDGAWTLSQNLDSEAFVWTPTWNKAIGSGTYDRFQSVVYSKDGASIYAVGDGYYEVDYKQSLVVKFATSDGAIGFSKYLNTTAQNAYATGVATIGASDIVVSGYERVGEPVNRDRQFVARLNDSGTVVWKKYYSDGNWGNSIDYNSDIQVDSDDNIYVTIQLRDDNTSVSFSDGFTVTKLDRDGNLLWSRCVSSNDSSYLGDTFGNRWSSLHNDQLVVAGYTYETDDDYYNGLWASFPTDGFVYSGGEDEFVQMGAFRFGRGRIKLEDTLIPPTGSFTPSVQPPNITAVTNFRNYATRTPSDSFPQHLHKMVDPKHGGVVFGDGSRQTTAADRIPQIRADNDYHITINDSGKHIYFSNKSGTVYIPYDFGYSDGVKLPVGFTFTIVNYTGNDCYVQLRSFSPRGTILGAGRNLDYHTWGIPDSGTGSMVTLILLETGHDYGNSNATGPVWMISGPGDIYIDD